MRFILLLLSVAVAGAGCKAKVEYKDRQETLDRLADLEKAVKDKDALINQLNRKVVDGGEGVVISMEGPKQNGEPGAIMEIRGRGPHGGGGGAAGGGAAGGGDSAADTQLYEAFIKQISQSRGSMQKCYETALKKRSDLQARPVTLNIQVDYRTSGKVSATHFNPRISEGFNRCMKVVAERWSLPKMPRVASFNYRTRLVPR